MSAFSLEDLQALSGSGLQLAVHSVPVGEWGEGKVAYIAELSADERDSRIDVAWHNYKSKNELDDNAHQRAWVAAACWCDSERNFVAATPAGIEAAAAKLGALKSTPVSRMYLKAVEVNGLLPDEDAEKN